jgi:hypothetical protein
MADHVRTECEFYSSFLFFILTQLFLNSSRRKTRSYKSMSLPATNRWRRFLHHRLSLGVVVIVVAADVVMVVAVVAERGIEVAVVDRDKDKEMGRAVKLEIRHGRINTRRVGEITTGREGMIRRWLGLDRGPLHNPYT